MPVHRSELGVLVLRVLVVCCVVVGVVVVFTGGVFLGVRDLVGHGLLWGLVGDGGGRAGGRRDGGRCSGGAPGATAGLGGHGLAVDQFDDRHGRVVALTRTDLGDPRVPAVALGVLRSDLGEQVVYHALVRDHGGHVPARVQVAALGEGDQALGYRP